MPFWKQRAKIGVLRHGMRFFLFLFIMECTVLPHKILPQTETNLDADTPKIKMDNLINQALYCTLLLERV